MKQFIASVRDPYDGKITLLRKEYKTKKAFAEDLRGNGYRIRFITTEEEFDEDCAKYYERIQRQTTIRKYIREARKG